MCVSDKLGMFERVEEASGWIQLTSHGWRLFLRHRHYSGNWDDCAPVSFERLTIGELHDTFDAVVASWPLGTPGQSA